mgnify:CR=1 FL=1|jgi:multiple sugar transport system ATP-binding protein
MAEVRLEKVSKRFGKRVWAVRDFDLRVEDREFLVLLGPSGCGKTTTLRMIAGLERPTAGLIYIGERLVNLIPPRDRDISMVFQSYAVWPHMRVYDNIAFGLRYGRRKKRLSKADIDRVVHEVASLVRIEELLSRYPTQLSGGQRQRVALARALAVKPQVFLYDEPLSNLDAKLRIQMRTELKYIHEQAGSTSIYVTHDQAEAMSMADRIMVMREGQGAQLGTPNEIYFRPANQFVAGFIGTPPMNMLEVELEEEDGGIKLVSPHFGFRLGEKTARAVQESGVRQAVLGVRPEDVTVSLEGGDFSAQVFVVEPQGPQQILSFKLDETLIIKSLTSADLSVSPGQEVWLSFNRERLHLFDRDTGVRLN